MKHFIADSIFKNFGPAHILSGARLECASGDIIGILGANGSGKSTFYKCLLGLYRHSIGTMFIDNISIERKKRLSCIAYLSQDSFLPLDYPIRKSIELLIGRENARLIETDEKIKGLLNARGGSLSLGERRYIECLLILSIEKPIILLDEPFSRIEPINCERISQAIQETASHKVILISDHLHENVRKTCNRLMILENGELLSYGN